MKKLFRCGVCGYIHEGNEPPENCPKCGAPKEKFAELSTDEANKIYKSDRTNDIHMEIATLSARMIKLCNEGIEINLDPGCLDTFQKARDGLWVIKQRSKAETQTHMNKGKW